MRISDTGTIELTGMSFHAFHGCLEQEKREGNEFTVDFRADCPIAAAALSDSLADTVDYGRIYDIIRREMEIPSDLLECVAARIVDAVAAEFPQLGRVAVKVSKKNPPVGGPVQWSSVTAYGK